MKKVIGVILAVILALFGGTATALASKSFVLSDLSMTMQLPDGWTVFTRDMDPGDEAFGVMDTDKKTVDELFQKSGIYLDALNEGKTLEIAVSMTKDTEGIFNLNLLSESEREDELNKIKDALAKNYTVTDSSQFKTEQATFLCADLSASMNEKTIYIREYATIINGNDIAITLCSYGGDNSEDNKSMMEGVMDSVTFTEVLDKPETTPAPSGSAQPAADAGMQQGILGGTWVWDVIAGVAVLGCIGYLIYSSSKRKSANKRGGDDGVS
jgi:hypothetical protein